MLDRGLVTQPDGHPGYSGVLSGANTSQEFYAQTGYALKELPAAACGAAPTRCFAVALNTNLGASNAVQNAALAADLAWAAGLGAAVTAGVYLLGHHPSVMQAGSGLAGRHASLVRGAFAGHTHVAASTVASTAFTQVGWSVGHPEMRRIEE